MTAPGSDAAGHRFDVVSHREVFKGGAFGVYSDQVVMPGGGTATRDYIHHPGAVAVVALDADGQVVLIKQYRHAVRAAIWELPAGLRDAGDEPPVRTAQRELAEEADLTAEQWHRLVDLHTTPGSSDELAIVYLARQLRPVTTDARHTREEEEAELSVHRFPLADAVAMALRGEITNGLAVAGLLATAAARDNDWAALRPPD